MARSKGLLAALAAVLLAASAFALYVSDYYHADETALAALVSDDVAVEQTDFGWFFDGPSEDAALVFYPGGKVDETAYAPLLHRLARQGPDVFLVKMPFRLAVFDVNAAEDVMARYDYDAWYVGGHSLGGAMAARCAAAHGDTLDGVILCAAYLTRPLDEDLTALLLLGSQDGIVSPAQIADGRQYAPARYTEAVIPGGNHAQFGSYGPQAGDEEAAISAEEQQKQAADIILAEVAKTAGGAVS